MDAKTVKKLRDATGAGMMDCKKALVENNEDMEAAMVRTAASPKWKMRRPTISRGLSSAERVGRDGCASL